MCLVERNKRFVSSNYTGNPLGAAYERASFFSSLLFFLFFFAAAMFAPWFLRNRRGLGSSTPRPFDIFNSESLLILMNSPCLFSLFSSFPPPPPLYIPLLGPFPDPRETNVHGCRWIHTHAYTHDLTRLPTTSRIEW